MFIGSKDHLYSAAVFNCRKIRHLCFRIHCPEVFSISIISGFTFSRKIPSFTFFFIMNGTRSALRSTYTGLIFFVIQKYFSSFLNTIRFLLKYIIIFFFCRAACNIPPYLCTLRYLLYGRCRYTLGLQRGHIRSTPLICSKDTCIYVPVH